MKLEMTPDILFLPTGSAAQAALISDPITNSLYQNSAAKMKTSLLVFLAFVLLLTLSAQRVEAGVFSESVVVSMVEDSKLAIEPEPQPVSVFATSPKKGVLEESEMAIGTILNSYHFSSYNFNESHSGLYISMNQWTVGTYLNSVNEQSVAVTYNSNLYRKESFKIDFVTGLANGYERFEYAREGYLPIVGVSAQWGFLKSVLLPDVVAIGIELPLN